MAVVDQEEHKLPQVYLKKFGYKNPLSPWKVSVGTIGSRNLNQMRVKRFTTALNHFDIDSKDDKIVKVFENQFNQLVETHYNNILRELEKGQITVAIKEYLSQTIPNFIVRSDKTRESVIEILASENRDDFIKFLIYTCRNVPGVIIDDPNGMFEMYKNIENEKLVNRILILLGSFIFLKLWSFNYVILRPPQNRQWWTSDNPVVAYDESDKKFFITKNAEIYFPLTPSLMVFLHHNGSINKNNPLRLLPHGTFHEVNNDEHDLIMKHITNNTSKHLILAGFHDDNEFV